ncbi:MAG: hypothetical protein HXS47_05695 [Theionarchaea archaeon]|nr:hypothetical protein [Theionarchaea archaeon]
MYCYDAQIKNGRIVYRLERVNPQRAWVYRKAAWAVDELENNISEMDDLTEISGIRPKIAETITEIIEQLKE